MSKYTPYIEKIEFNNNILSKDFNIVNAKSENKPKFNLGYHYYTKQVREKMINSEFLKRDYYLIANEFESKVPDHKDDLDNNIPKVLKSDKIMSRDFYKLWEMLVYFDLANDKSIKSLSLSENGGFLQAINEFRKHYYDSKKDEYCYQSSNGNGCLKGSLKGNKLSVVNSHLENLDTSNTLQSSSSIKKFIKDNKLDNIDLVTSNGTIQNFNNNLESNLYGHLFGHLVTALSVQKNGGTFILRVEDIFTNVTIKMITILSNCYDKVNICKPLFSRNFNNERYIICQNLKLSSTEKNKLIKKLEDLLDEISKSSSNNEFLFDIATSFELDNKIIENFANINNKINNLEHININKIIQYKKGKNYFGEQYHKFRDGQLEANKWWQETFIKDNSKKLADVRKSLVK